MVYGCGAGRYASGGRGRGCRGQRKRETDNSLSRPQTRIAKRKRRRKVSQLGYNVTVPYFFSDG